MNKEITTLLIRMLQMINGFLAFGYVALFSWLAVELFNILF